MKLPSLFISSALLAVTSASALAGPDNDGLSPKEKKAVEQVVHDYLLQNPEILLEVSDLLQQKQQQQVQTQAKSDIQQNADRLFNEELAILGNPEGNVTVVEFFDYQCIHCKKMSPILAELVESDKNVRIIYKEFPIFGKSSTLASKAALAAAKQGKYKEMHEALFKLGQNINQKTILAAAKPLGLNMDKFEKDMDSEEITKALDANRQLAEALHLLGTPALVIAATPGGKLKPGSEPAFIPGGASKATVNELIGKQRATIQ